MKNIISTAMSMTAAAALVLIPLHSKAQAQNTAITQAVFQAQEEASECLALNIYYEARSSNLADKAAVADVVLNRSLDRRYPGSICEVVQDGYKPGRSDCQFSWYCDGKEDVPHDMDRWNEAQSIAWDMITLGKYRGITEGATHYHATYVDPYWADSLQMVGTIGKHVFYRWE